MLLERRRSCGAAWTSESSTQGVRASEEGSVSGRDRAREKHERYCFSSVGDRAALPGRGSRAHKVCERVRKAASQGAIVRERSTKDIASRASEIARRCPDEGVEHTRCASE